MTTGPTVTGGYSIEGTVSYPEWLTVTGGYSLGEQAEILGAFCVTKGAMFTPGAVEQATFEAGDQRLATFAAGAEKQGAC